MRLTKSDQRKLYPLLSTLLNLENKQTWKTSNCQTTKLSKYRDHHIHGGARSVMVIVVGSGHGHTSSNPGRDWLHFTLH